MKLKVGLNPPVPIISKSKDFHIGMLEFIQISLIQKKNSYGIKELNTLLQAGEKQKNTN